MKLGYNSPVVLTLVLGAVAVQAITHFIDAGFTQRWFVLHGNMNWGEPVEYLRWFSYILGHGDWQHLMNNMILILLVGPVLEEKFGHGYLLLMILLTAGVTAVLQVFIWNDNLLGASGIAFMLVLLGSLTNVRQGQIPLTFILVAVFFLGKEILAIMDNDGISQMAHLVGGACGSFFGFSHMQLRDSDPPLEE